VPPVSQIRTGTTKDTWWGSGIADEEFDAFIEHWADDHVYLATDSARTQGRFLQQLGKERMPALTRVQPSAALRQTTLRAAVMDLFVCAASDGPFKGSWTSSFSDTIARIRHAHGRTHTRDEHAIASVTKKGGDEMLRQFKVAWLAGRSQN
jgi:hypothetical protein